MSALKPGVVLGVDLGTSGVRVVAFSERFQPLAEEGCSYSVAFGAAGQAEQDPRTVALAAEDAIAAVAHALRDTASIRALSLCGTASSLGAFSEQPQGMLPVSPAWIWSDIRSAQEAEEVRRKFGAATYSRTGCPAHASYWPAKLWHQGRNARNGANVRLGGIKDYLLYRLTGEWATDESMAAATGMYDSIQRTWDRELMGWLNVDPAALPAVVSPTHSFRLTPTSASRLGLGPDTLVVAGALDGVLAHVGLGGHGGGMASCMVGTSGAVRFGSTSRATDALARTWCYPVGDGTWVVGGAGNNGGNVIEWLCALLGAEDQPLTADRVVALAKGARADGPVFLPYLFGERSPLWRADLKGAFLGLTPQHGRAEVARSVLVGISLGLLGIYRALWEQVGPPREIRASGGFVASPEWVQLQADVFGAPISVVGQAQPTSAGAAMMGWSAITGASLAEWKSLIPKVRTYEPSPEEHRRYSELYDQMNRLREQIWPGPTQA